MTVNEQKIADELRLIAGEAQPVNALAYASRAATGASRRRRLSLSLAGLAVAAASVVGVLVVIPSTGGQNIAAQVAGLPQNTPEQLRAVRECMPMGGPVHDMDGKQRIPEHGKTEDFRVLVEYRDAVGSTALVGSTAGFVFCTPQKYEAFAERAVFTYWGYQPPGDLAAGLSGSLTVDAYEDQTDSHGMRDDDQSGGSYRVVAGRVAPGVRRVEIDWADGRRTDAQVANGFFVGRVLGKSVSDPEGGVDASGEPMTILDTPSVTVTAYDETDQVVRQEKDVTYAWRGPASRPTPRN
ncbi:hypothetical protein [Streptosporangium sp. NBC_01756]|uniref:hypothetical protein n=1 Tax=Streptosporangium sp. NBC_01756 TaxID=2975950 RepID=UPI002DD97A0C|nr:hypothetical protein [Streptosporangium sp. NBC_01756]WSC83402.1 hypothetical protein OIE48_23650 [Streptosporangium sp. NBC_01756]